MALGYKPITDRNDPSKLDRSTKAYKLFAGIMVTLKVRGDDRLEGWELDGARMVSNVLADDSRPACIFAFTGDMQYLAMPELEREVEEYPIAAGHLHVGISQSRVFPSTDWPNTSFIVPKQNHARGVTAKDPTNTEFRRVVRDNGELEGDTYQLSGLWEMGLIKRVKGEATERQVILIGEHFGVDSATTESYQSVKTRMTAAAPEPAQTEAEEEMSVASAIFE